MKRSRLPIGLALSSALCSFGWADSVWADRIEIPHAQTKPPGPPVSAEQAQRKFTVPDGFRVQLVAGEPEVVNPVAMTWDDRGRIWVCESLEYPRFEPGEGRDRIRIHEDTDNDGITDHVKTFAGGLNIPSGIAVGYGGVFVANAPDILFLRDTDGDDRADRTEVLLTGFGRADVHEVPNCLTWGPDGWLYGLNGVFNPSTISYRGETHKFTCALWRYHPVSRAFELYARGTSNPWGLDYNRAGHWFVSACVIDHLWHLTQSGYYQRQSGAYPPNVWKLGSIVDHKHQLRAYCGLMFYDAPQYPAEFRGNLLMGNIHGGCVNRDWLERDDATYKAHAKSDFLIGNDVWFMPVSQKVGPDGSVWILDWYDRYHCYQDARRDPEGIDRLRGRIWRVVYGDTAMPPRFNLAELSNEKLIELLSHPNVWWRRKARRILTERNDPATVRPLESLALSTDSNKASNNGPMNALWTLIGMGRLGDSFRDRVLAHSDPRYRAWGIRAAAEKKAAGSILFARLRELAGDSSPDVRVQVAIASSRLEHPDAFGLLLAVMEHPEPDRLLPHIVWENLHPRIDGNADALADWLASRPIDSLPITSEVAYRAVDLLLPRGERDPGAFRKVFRAGLGDADRGKLASHCVDALWTGVRNRELADNGQNVLDAQAKAALAKRFAESDKPSAVLTSILAAWGNDDAVARARAIAADRAAGIEPRRAVLDALALINDPGLAWQVGEILTAPEAKGLKKHALNAVARLGDPPVASMLVSVWEKLPAELKPVAIDHLAGRKAWARQLLSAVEAEKIPKTAVNTNHLRKILQLDDEPLAGRVRNAFGLVREGRNPDREKVIDRMRRVFNNGKKNAADGQVVFKQLCAQCHQIYGHGTQVGPDITENGRASLDQILSNVLDPNLVIGQGYIARTVITTEGQVSNGILVEDTDRRIVLKVAGGEQKIIPRDQVEQVRVSKISLMPEELETGISEQAFRDLIAFLLTRNPPKPWAEVPDVEPKDYGTK